jgi:hypothetical protein
MSSKQAIAHLRKTGDINEAVDIVLGRKKLTEAGEPRQQSQTWFLPSQQDLNQFVLRLLQYLPDSQYKVDPSDKGGFEVKVTGVYADHDVATLAGAMRGSRIDHPAGTLE